MEDLGVAGVRRLAAEHELRIRRSPDLLVQAGVIQESEAGAARVGRHVRRPQPRLARVAAKLLYERERGIVLAPYRRFAGIDVLLHERAIARPRVEVGLREEGHDVSRIV